MDTSREHIKDDTESILFKYAFEDKSIAPYPYVPNFVSNNFTKIKIE